MQVKGDWLLPCIRESCNEDCLGQSTIPRYSDGNCLGGYVAADLHGTRSHLQALSFLFGSFKRHIGAWASPKFSSSVLTNHGVQSNVRRRQDALTQNIYSKMIKRWATWWWCKWWHGRKFNFVLPGKLIFFQNSALVFTLCSCDSSYTITESTCSSLFIFKASTFYFPHLKPSVSKAFQC